MSAEKAGDTSLTERMRADWDRRVRHDYRFWMSDGVENDASMWSSGARDFEILIAGLDKERLRSGVAVEIGCGVGRLLRPASEIFRNVIGVDVSPEALRQAQRLLADRPNISFVPGSGVDLAPVESGSADFVFSFASLSNVPKAVLASYLVESARILKHGGLLTLQVYIGAEQSAPAEDTLAIRSFEKQHFLEAVQRLGFEPEKFDELKLPFEVSDSSKNVVAYLLRCRKAGEPQIELSGVESLLASQQEAAAGDAWEGSVTEYAMALSRAQQHLDAGNVREAREALEYAVSSYRRPEPEVVALLSDLRRAEKGDFSAPGSRGTSSPASSAQVETVPLSSFGTEIFDCNMQVVRERFPEVARILEQTALDPTLTVERGHSGAPVIVYRQTAVDQVDKPARSGEVWAEQTLCGPRVKQSRQIFVAGYAGGYHLEAMLHLAGKPVHAVEPEPQILKAAMMIRDQRRVLRELATLSVTMEGAIAVLSGSGGDSGGEIVVHPQTQILARGFVDALKRRFWSVRGIHELRPSIAVVGPIYGGSLPIAGYTAAALTGLKQRVQYYNMSTFAQPYFGMSEVVKTPARLSVLQGHYVEMLSQIVLEGISERPVDIVICLAQAPLSPRVLMELRNRGVITVMWFVEDCRRFLTWRDISRYFDYMFLIQRDEFPRKVEEAGAGRAIYLPVGCHPAVHRPVPLTEEERARWGSAISFVGAGYNNRVQMFASLAGRDFKIWGTEWPVLSPFDTLVQEKGRRISPDEYIKIFCSSEINLNLHSSMERDGVEPNGDFVNPRTFELAACGAFQLIDNRELLPDLFEVGREVATFSDRLEMEKLIDYYLAHPAERQNITAAAQARALRDHTYEQRLQQMLGCIYADRFDQLKARALEGPWPSTLKAAEAYPELKSKFEALFDRGADPKLDLLVADVQLGKGALTETEQKLLFLYHVKKQISYVNDLRAGKAQ